MPHGEKATNLARVTERSETATTQQPQTSRPHQPKPGPLAGIRVIEMGQLIAGPFCGQLLGDMGAEVIKIEEPTKGDPMRTWGQTEIHGSSLWFNVIARNKKSVTLNLRQPAGQDIARRLIATADILIENFRPGSMEKWGLDYDTLAADNPGLIMARVSGFGQSGPQSKQPGFGSVGEAMGGLRYVVGDPSAPPSRAGISIGDTLAGTFSTVGVLAALQERHRSGLGQVVDTAIYESVLSVMESLVPEYAVFGLQRERTGSMLPKIAPSNVYPTADGTWLVIGANQDTIFRRLAAAMGHPEWGDSEEYGTHVARGERQAELDETVAAFTMSHSADELVDILAAHDVPAGKIFRVEDMMRDGQFAARGSLVDVETPDYGTVTMQNAFPRLSRTDSAVRWPGPALGADTAEVLRGLGVGDDELETLRTEGIVR